MQAQKENKSGARHLLWVVMLLAIALLVAHSDKLLHPRDTDYTADGRVTVHFIDVGQGCATLIQSGRQGILVDAGEAEYADRVIAADMNRGERCLDILAHMDVVAPGDGWTKTAPFEPIVEDGMIIGRGSSDDKGPAVAALYAMRAVKELGLPVTKNCRLVLGSDEECGSSDIPYYYAVEPEAPMTFSPDAEFPLINVEKGQFRGELTAALNQGCSVDV